MSHKVRGDGVMGWWGGGGGHVICDIMTQCVQNSICESPLTDLVNYRLGRIFLFSFLKEIC